MREKFTDEEWSILLILPIIGPMLVARADGVVDKKEMEELHRQALSASMLKDPLHRELLSDLKSLDEQKIIQTVEPAQYIQKSKDILKKHLGDDEYQRFIGSIFINALKVVQASGGVLGFGDKVSDVEKLALATFATAFDLDPDSLKKLRDVRALSRFSILV